MTPADQKKLIRWNTALWLLAMVLPAFLSIAFASTRFPWPLILPLLLFGAMLGSNKMLVRGMQAALGSSKPEARRS